MVLKYRTGNDLTPNDKYEMPNIDKLVIFYDESNSFVVSVRWK